MMNIKKAIETNNKDLIDKIIDQGIKQIFYNDFQQEDGIFTFVVIQDKLGMDFFKKEYCFLTLDVLLTKSKIHVYRGYLGADVILTRDGKNPSKDLIDVLKGMKDKAEEKLSELTVENL